MFPTDEIRSPPRWNAADRARRLARIGAVSVGLGLGTAVAAELTITPAPEPAPAFGDLADASAGWRYFDPGFLVDHLPFKLTIGQTISYGDNVANQPANGSRIVGVNGVSRLPSRGDFFSDTTLAIASRFPMGAQTFFFNGTYAPRRYFTDTDLNADNYAINGGVDFNVANRCSGRLIGGVDQSQNPLEQTVGFGVQDIRSVSFNETARCEVGGHVATLFNSGVSRVENSGAELGITSALSTALNNYNQYYVGGGLEYALSSLDTLRGLVTITHRDFTDRPPVALTGLADATDQQDYQIFYSRIFSAKLDGSASGGLSVFSFPGIAGTTEEPVYSFQLNYRLTPKFAASGTVARSAGAPQSAISNVQVSDTESLSLNYAYSPKLSVTGVYSHSTTQNPGAVNRIANSSLLFANSVSDNASVVLNYRASPLLTATAAYSFVNRTDTSRSGFDAVSNIFRVGLVYTR